MGQERLVWDRLSATTRCLAGSHVMEDHVQGLGSVVFQESMASGREVQRLWKLRRVAASLSVGCMKGMHKI